MVFKLLSSKFQRNHRLPALPFTSSRVSSPSPSAWYSFAKRLVQPFLISRLPPLYEDLRVQERHLPHYAEYERKPVKYFFPANHATSSGWGNVMQDYVMMGLLAHAANRSYVFDDYIWNPDGSIYSDYNGKLIPSAHSSLVPPKWSRPMVGGPMPPGDDTPRAVSKEFFNNVCPNPTVLNVTDVNTWEMRFDPDVSTTFVFDTWVEKLNSIEDPCIFEYWIFGEKKFLSVLPLIANSPITTQWGWSPLIHDAFRKNRHLFQPTRLDFFGNSIDPGGEDMRAPIPGLLAIHIHCQHLAKWNADWNAFNAFPEFVDKWVRPEDGTPEEKLEIHMQRCYPPIELMVEKVRQVRAEAKEELRYLYIMTNGAVPWVQELKAALTRDMRWDHVGSSRDLKLTWEQKFWSSMTSNVVMLRLAQGFEFSTHRFW
ncbi:hypothetical protein BU15DRAFT_86101 [Melanogaster broomeanus]|nr:hypothetical protein BU15DRAFT_86101 [Melanogaster broomeanus]